MHPTQKQQHIACQVGQCAIAALILAPTAINLSTVERQVSACTRLVSGDLLARHPEALHSWQPFSCNSSICRRVRACLPSKAASVEEEWPAHLLAMCIDSRCRQ